VLRGMDVNDLTELKRQGLSIRAISRLTGMDRKTIRKYLIAPEVPVYGPRAVHASKLDEFKNYLQDRMQAGVWNARVLLREVRERCLRWMCVAVKSSVAPDETLETSEARFQALTDLCRNLPLFIRLRRSDPVRPIKPVSTRTADRGSGLIVNMPCPVTPNAEPASNVSP
jgi:hypothetical protein